MASSFTIGLLMGVGFGAWVYNKMMHSTGSNVKNSLTVAGFAGLGALAIVVIILGTFLK